MHFSSARRVVGLIILWVGAQALWLSQAYQLEFLARDKFVTLWLSSIALLLVHVVCTQQCLKAWVEWRHRQVVSVTKAQ